MEILFLNTYNGRLRRPLGEFLAARAGRTDVFCLQEVYGGEESYYPKNGSMRELAASLLPGYQSYYAYKEIEADDFPQATYVHHRITIAGAEVLFPAERDFGLGIITAVEYNGRRLTICNFHGRSKPGDKKDTPERKRQSRGIIDRFKCVFGPKVIGGDFNADIATESIEMFREAGYRNLIGEMAIRTTRNRIAWERYPEAPQLHSDFVFVSPEVIVRGLEVPENEISDHLPLVLTVE